MRIEPSTDGGIKATEEKIDREIFFNRLLDECNDGEAAVLVLKLTGMSSQEIADHLEYSISNVNKIMRSIKSKGQEIGAIMELST